MTPTPSGRVLQEAPVITIVSDPGVDDMVALVLIDRLFPNAEKILVSTFGNNSAAITGRNAERAVGHLGGRWVHRRGATLPMHGPARRGWAIDYHGPDGIWGTEVPGREPPRSTTEQPRSPVISLAPLFEPLRMEQAMLISEITLMAGCFADTVTRPEFNIGMDVEAAHQFFELPRHQAPQVVPEEVTRSVCWSLDHVLSIPGDSPRGKWLKQMLLRWFDNYGTPLNRDFPLHDPVAAYLARHPERATWKTAGVHVAVGGDHHGRTTFSDGSSPCRIARRVDRPDHLADELFALIFEF